MARSTSAPKGPSHADSSSVIRSFIPPPRHPFLPHVAHPFSPHLRIRFFFSHSQPLDTAALARAYAEAFLPTERVLILCALPWQHAATELALALRDTGAMVATVDIERPAESATECADASASVADSVLCAGGAPGELLGRKLPRECADDADLRAVQALLYIGTKDQTLSNLCVLLSNAEVHLCTPPVALCTPPVAAASPRALAVAPPPSADLPEASADSMQIERLSLLTAQRMMRRYYLVDKAKEARVAPPSLNPYPIPRTQYPVPRTPTPHTHTPDPDSLPPTPVPHP